jgi:subtilisin family serine protease
VTRRVLPLLALLLLAAAALAPAPSSAEPRAQRYIVVLEDGENADQVAAEHGRRYGAQVKLVYERALKGYAAVIPEDRVDRVKADDRVDYVERDGEVRAVAQALPWGVDKVDADLSSTKAGDGSGSVNGVDAYVIDSGVYSHSDLVVDRNVNFAGGKNTDCNGHGTHVAGTIAAKDNSSDVVGVAPGVRLTGVKVLGCSGSGSTSGVIAGVDWVTKNARKPAVANMSLGGSPSQALDDAVKRSAASGVVYTVAAGNDGADACGHSPARAGTSNGVITTGATTTADAAASFSNYGSCVDLWAPGVNIVSTRKGGGTTTLSGTSMAAPHVGGGAALYLSSQTGKTPAEVEAALKSSAASTGNQSKDGRAIQRLNVGGY